MPLVVSFSVGSGWSGWYKRLQQAGLTCAALPQDEHLGFIQMVYLAQRSLAEVVEDGVVALLYDLRGWICERAVFDVDAATFR